MRKHLHGIVVCGLLLAWPAGRATADKYVWKDGKWVAAVQPAEGTPEGELAALRTFVEQRDRKKALAAAEKLLKTYPGQAAREEAMLLAGQAELDGERYYQAYEWFEKMIGEFPNGEFLERALMREIEAANAFLAGKPRIVGKVFRLPARDEGLSILRRVAEHAPGSTIAEKALLRIGEYHYQRGEYADAAAAYDHYLELFAKSPRAPDAMVQAAQSTYESFKGVPYDETPLIEAEQRYKALLDQYPAIAKKARAREVLTEISETRARRTYETGRFYQRTGRPEAARFYFQRVLDEYSSSAWAHEARAALRGAPPKPAGDRAGATGGPKPAPQAGGEPKATSQPGEPAGQPVDLEDLAKPKSKGSKP